MAALTDGTAAVLTDRRAPDIVASAGEVDGELTVFALRTVRIVVSPPGALWAAAVSESMWTAVGVAFDDLLAAAGLPVFALHRVEFGPVHLGRDFGEDFAPGGLAMLSEAQREELRRACE